MKVVWCREDIMYIFGTNYILRYKSEMIVWSEFSVGEDLA